MDQSFERDVMKDRTDASPPLSADEAFTEPACETGYYLKSVLQLLDAPDIKRAFHANTKWDVVEIVSNRYLGGITEPSQGAKMAESGRRILQFVADNDFKTAIDPILFQSTIRLMDGHAEAWVAAYHMTPGGGGFSGVTLALRSVLGVQQAAGRWFRGQMQSCDWAPGAAIRLVYPSLRG